MTTSTISRVFLLVTVITSFITTATCLGSSRASFGEACDKEVRCDSRNFISCSTTGVCECFMGDSMAYDEMSRKCVALAGERCQLTTVKGDNTWIVELPCVIGGNCTTGVCDCLPGYFERSDGFCSVKRRHEENCTRNEMCDSNEHLICGKDKTCVCDDEHGLSFEDNDCKILAGYPCGSNLTAKCTTGATCTSSQVCSCSANHFQALNGTCIKKRRKYDSCNSNIECLDTYSGMPTFLTCSEGQCKCNTSLAVDDVSSLNGFCLKPLGQSCNSQSPNNCIEGAICASGTCQCNTTVYYENESKLCELRRGYNESCKKDLECQSSYRCDSTNKCVCATGKSFSMTLNRCAWSVGSDCERISPYGDGCSESCVPNASGQEDRTRYGYSQYGRYYKYVCRCNSGFTTSTIRNDGLCYSTAGYSCDGDMYGPPSSKQCLPGLICRDGACKCMFVSHQRYNSDTQSCQSYVGGPCTNSSDCYDSNTECVGDGEYGMKICGCTQGSVQDGRTCSPSKASYGAKCNPGTCDKTGGLECTSKGICECPFLQEFNGENCVGLVGSRCSVSLVRQDVMCEKGSFCKPFPGLNQNFGLCTCLPGYNNSESRHCILQTMTVKATSASTTQATTEDY